MRNRPRVPVTIALVIGLMAVALSQVSAAQPPRPVGLVTAIPAAGAGGNPLARLPLFVDTESRPRAQAERWRATRPADAALLDRIAREPQAMWVGSWYPDVRATVAGVMRRARAARQMPVFVAYNIPHRDCFGANSGGAMSPREYRAWIARLAAGIGRGPAAVVLEPDALAAVTCLPPRLRRERIAMLRWATARLARQPGTAVYIDAGHATWIPVGQMARRLRAVGVKRARGFALNVSNFHTTKANVRYGARLSRAVGGARFVVDTGRNGAGPKAGDWCNPPGRALGAAPTTATGHPLMDAGLWIKAPGESDGTCNGGPGGGAFWPEYALRLVRAAR
ncbi:MAG: glycoside hydrolase family 6 protein [Thermoleophilia bacterium]